MRSAPFLNDARLGIIDYLHDAPSSSFAAARKTFPPDTREYSRLGHAWLSRIGQAAMGLLLAQGSPGPLTALIASQFRAYSPTHTLDRVLGLPSGGVICHLRARSIDAR